LHRLELADFSTCDLPTSLELAVWIAAESNESIDAGRYQLVIGPTVGSHAAGRTLGRFAHLVPGGTAALECCARAEEDLRPDLIWAELVFQPHSFRLGNVSTRPNVRTYEIAVGLTPGRSPAETIPLSELVVGVRDDHFYIRWPAAGRDVAITATHMLNHRRAPAVCRALFELNLDRRCLLTQLQWESVSRFPFLPRLQVGRVVISLARWLLARDMLPDSAIQDAGRFAGWFERWCAEWQVPRRVYLRLDDERLLLDLTVSAHVDELRREIAGLPAGGAVVISEVLPELDEAWTRNAEGRPFMTEFVVPLVRRTPSERERRRVASSAIAQQSAPAVTGQADPEMSSRRWLRPPGSDWIFAKFYCIRSLEDELIVGSLRVFADRAHAAGLVSKWFFLRYGDPDRHVRIRFNGAPERLLTELVPPLCTLASELVARGLCTRFALDTYEREIDRFGGDDALAAVERWFAEDSYVVADCLELLSARASSLPWLPFAVLTVDALLDGLGVDVVARAAWCRQQVRLRHIAGTEYRQWKSILRPMLAAGDGRERHALVPGLDRIRARVRAAASALRQELADVESRCGLTRAVDELIPSFVHLHLNRLSGEDRRAEERILGLLWRIREGLHHSGSRTTSSTATDVE
jgi:thiopeptide-type bacteriocin biosynthesis protein